MSIKPMPTKRSVIDIGRKCNINCHFCLSGNTLILMDGWSWKRIDELKEGDTVIGFDNSKKIVTSRVKKTMIRYSDLYRIYFDGGFVDCTEDHLWLNNIGKWFSLNNRIKIGSFRSKIRHISNPAIYVEDEDYMKGYICGIFDTDGSHNRLHKKEENYTYQWASIRVRDKEIIDFSKKALEKMNINVEKTVSNNYYKGEKYYLNRLEFRDKNRYDMLVKLLEECNLNHNSMNDNYHKGYIAACFDADGSKPNDSLRIGKYEHDKYGLIKNKIKYSFSKLNYKIKSEPKSIRLLGGSKEIIRFFSECNPKVKRKKELLKYNISSKKIIDVKYVGYDKVYNIETETGNYFANGLASHNCYYHHMGDLRQQTFLSKEKIINLIDQAKARGNNYLDWTGGEPTILPFLPELIEYALKKHRMKSCVISNATVGENTLQKIIDAGVDQFLLSIHGSEKSHNELTGLKDARKRQIRFINQLKENNISYRVNCVLSKHVQNSWDETINYILEIKPSIVNFINMNPHGQWAQDLDGVRKVITDLKIIEHKLNESIELFESEGIGVNVRYYPMCRIKEEYRRTIANDLHVTFDPYEW
ncbi:MAG: radical SAM protein, partial [bacterium]